LFGLHILIAFKSFFSVQLTNI